MKNVAASETSDRSQTFNMHLQTFLCPARSDITTDKLISNMEYIYHTVKLLTYTDDTSVLLTAKNINELQTKANITLDYMSESSWDSSVGIATGYGLDGPGTEAQWGSDFSHMSRLALGPTQPPAQWIPGLLQG
jgi:hypothetical protein